MASPFISLTEYKSYYNIASTNKDAQFTQAITYVSSWIRSYTGRSFDAAVTTEYFSGDADIYFVENFPITSLLEVSTSLDGGATRTVLVEGTDFYADMSLGCVETTNGRLFRRKPLFKFLAVKYTSVPDIPDDLKLAAILLVNYYLSEDFKPRKSTGVHNIDSVNESQQMPYYIQQSLDMYRNFNV